MEPTRLDTLARTLSRAGSRRTSLRVLLGSLLGGRLLGPSLDALAAPGNGKKTGNGGGRTKQDRHAGHGAATKNRKKDHPTPPTRDPRDEQAPERGETNDGQRRHGATSKNQPVDPKQATRKPHSQDLTDEQRLGSPDEQTTDAADEAAPAESVEVSAATCLPPGAKPCKRGSQCCSGRCKRKRKKCLPCRTGTEYCPSLAACADPSQYQTDPNNCGSCGNDCGGKATCDQGSCRVCDVCAEGCPFTSVQAAVAAANNGDTIVICSGRYAETVTIDKDITLRGAGSSAGGTVLDAQQTDSVVTIEGATTVELDGLHITGGNAVDAGGGVSNRWGGTLTLRDCQIRDNAAPGGGYGGGVFSDGATATLINCVIADNAARYGGGIGNGTTGSMALKGCTIDDNEASQAGGGLYNAGTLEADDTTTLTHNSADPIYYSGAINNLGELTLNGTTVADNAGGLGNGFHASATLRGCTFTGNTLPLLNDAGTIRAENCVFSGNLGDEVVHNSSGEVEISGSQIGRNQGIGIYVAPGSSLTLTDSEVFEQTGRGIGNWGKLTLDGVTVRNNAGGGIFASGDQSVTIRSSIIRDNAVPAGEGGGGIVITGAGVVNLIDSTVSGNTAAGGAGIFNLQDTTVHLSNTTVQANRALTSQGGGISSYGGMTIEGGEVTENTAGSHGGGIHNEGSLTVSACPIRANIAGQQTGGGGGGLRNAGSGTARLIDVLITANKAAWNGGGISNVPGASVTLEGTSTVTNNKPNNCADTSACSP